MARSRTATVVAVAQHGVEVVEADWPTLPPGGLVVQMIESGLCGTDLYKLDSTTAPPGTVLGHEVVGRVVLSDDDHFEIGTRVATPHHRECGACDLCRRGAPTQCATFKENLLDPGAFSTHFAVGPRALRGTVKVVPETMSSTTAALLEPTACVVRSIHRAALSERDHAAVLGAGSMGLLHALVLRCLAPTCEVVLVEPDEARAEQARELGLECWTRADRPHQQGFAGAVFDTAGGGEALDLATRLLRPGGAVVLFAHAPDAPRVDLNQVFHRELRILTTYSSSAADQDEAWALLCAGRLDPTPVVSHRLPLADFERACDLVRSRQALKVMLQGAAYEGALS